MKAPHDAKKLLRADFMAWLDSRGATLAEPTNQYELVRYKMWGPDDKRRPSIHIIYRRGNGSLTYTGESRAHYETFCADKGRGL